MKKVLTIFLSLSFIIAMAQNPNLLFEANYDSYSQHADFAKGEKKAFGFPESDLQLRMYPGVKGASKVNSLQISNSERVYYKAYNNVTSEQGTISFWFQMVNYNLRNNSLQSFIYLTDNQRGKVNKDFFIRVIKNKNEWQEFIIAQIHYKDQKMKKPFTRQIQVYTRPFKWQTRQWHNIVITWNKNNFNLYIDGVLHPKSSTGGPRVDEFSKHIPYDNASKSMDNFQLPSISKNARLYIGNLFGSANKGDTTAFDKVQIFNRPLSANEIKKLYEEVMPPVKKEQTLNFIGIPFTNNPKEATRCFMHFPMAKPEIKFNAYADIYRDNTNLYVKFVSDRKCMVKKHTKRDAYLWEDDSFEIHMKNQDNNYYQFIVNGNGAIFDHQNKKHSWNAIGVKTKITHTKNGWSALLTVPLKNFSTLKGDWLFDVCTAAITGSKMNYYRWSNKIYDGGFTATGEMKFLPKGYFFSLENIGNLSIGNLNLVAKGSKNVKVAASYLPLSGYRNTYTGNLLKSPWFMTLPAGEQSLNIEAKAGKTLIYRYNLDYYVDYPMEIKFNTAQKEKLIQLDIDFANAGGKALAHIAKNGIIGTIVLKDKNNKVYSQGSFKTNNAQCKAVLPFPKNLKSGNYKIEAKAGNLTRTINYRVPNLAPYIEKVSADSYIPTPWTPIKEVKKNTYSVWNRVYTFDGKSPFPKQVTANNANLLVNSPTLLLNGKEPKWNNWQVTKKQNDIIYFAGSGVIDNVKIAYTSQLHFDGMYLLKWDVTPSNKYLINNMKITYSMPFKFATHVYNPELVNWQNNKASVSLLPDTSRKNNVLWLSCYDKGFLFWTKSNANWVNQAGEKPLTAAINGNNVDVSLNIISKAATLTKKAAYTFIFQATPTRALPKNHREEFFISHGKCSETTIEFGNTGCGRDKPRIDDASVYNGCYPRDFKEFAQHNAKRKVKNIMYTAPGHLSDYAADYDYWDKKNLSKPGAVFLGKKLGVNQMSYLFCSNATDAPADLWSWWCNDAMKKLKNYNGLYFDLAMVRYCENTEHGCSGKDAFGQTYISNDALGLRNFFMRCYKTCKRNNGNMMIHCHVAYTPFAHITEYFAPGENTCAQCTKNPYWAYCEEIPLIDYQTTYNQFRSGVGYKFILQNGRACDLTPALKHIPYLTDISMAYQSLAPMVVHDIAIWGHYIHKPTINKLWTIYRQINITDAIFHPYWINPIITTTSKKTYASVYEWKNPKAPYKRMIVASNFTRQAQKANLKINFQKMGINPATAKFVDIWNNKPLTLAQINDLTIGGGRFIFIGIK